MKYFGTKNGFTLIEIIIVLVIIGVLAAIAVSSYSNWILKSQGTEAVLNMKNLADQMDACIAKGGNYEACGQQVIPPTPGYTATPNFTIWNLGTFPDGYSFEAIPNQGSSVGSTQTSCTPADIGSTVESNVILLCSSLNGQRTLIGAGYYAGMF